MQLSVTFRHMDATAAIKGYAKDKVERITKYFPDPIKAHVVLSCDRGYNHVADVVITLHNGIVIKGEESTEDMYSSIDLVMAKIERQVRRYKEKIRNHRPTAYALPEVEIQHSVVQMANGGELARPTKVTTSGKRVAVAKVAAKRETPQEAKRGFEAKIIRKSKFFAKPLSVEEAVMQMNLLGNSFLVFSNASTRDVNVVYRRDDGTYGLIETGATRAS